MTTPNIFTYATSELSQDATFAYILAWADPTYNKSHPHLHALGTELLRSLLSTQAVTLPQIKTLHIETQVGSRSNRIDILVRINTDKADKNGNRIILLIEDKVNAKEHSDQKIKHSKKFVKKKYKGSYDDLVAVYLKTGNESRTSFLCWLGHGDLWIGTQDRFANLYMQIHDATRLTVRLGRGNALDKVHGLFMWAVFDALNQVNTETSNDFRIEKAGIFRGGGAAAVADITFGDRDTWLAVDEKGIVNMDASIEHLHLVAELLRKVAKCDELLKHVE